MRVILFFSILLIACAHQHFDDVAPGEGGLNTVIVKNPEESEARREALRQSRAFCEDQKKLDVITDMTSKYYGDVREETYQRMRRAGKAIEEITGGTIKKGDKAASDYAGAGYEVNMKFRCEPR